MKKILFFIILTAKLNAQISTYKPIQNQSLNTIDLAILKRQNFDKNNAKLEQTFIEIIKYINELKVTEFKRNIIFNEFEKSVKKLDILDYDISTSNGLNKSINYLYGELSKILERNNAFNEATYYKLSDFYDKQINIYKIVKYEGKEKIEQKIQFNSFIVIKDDEIIFRKADGEILTRKIKSLTFNPKNEEYEITTNYGNVLIDNGIKFIIFFQSNSFSGDRYVYYIDKY